MKWSLLMHRPSKHSASSIHRKSLLQSHKMVVNYCYTIFSSQQYIQCSTVFTYFEMDHGRMNGEESLMSLSRKQVPVDMGTNRVMRLSAFVVQDKTTVQRKSLWANWHLSPAGIQFPCNCIIVGFFQVYFYSSLNSNLALLFFAITYSFLWKT